MSRPWMPLYVSDYLADTGHLSGAEHGAYLLLIMHYWQKGGLPDDDRRLASIARATAEQWSDMRDTIAEFFGPGWTHERIDAELEKAEDKYRKRAEAGRKGGNAKATGKQNSSNAKAGLNQPQPQPELEKEEPNGSSKKNGCRLPADFVPDTAWAVAQGLSSPQAHTEAEKFRDYWNAKTGKDATKRDWPGTWRNWVRNALSRLARGSPPPRQPSKAEVISNIRESLRHEYPADGRNSRPDGDHGFLVPVARRTG